MVRWDFVQGYCDCDCEIGTVLLLFVSGIRHIMTDTRSESVLYYRICYIFIEMSPLQGLLWSGGWVGLGPCESIMGWV